MLSEVLCREVLCCGRSYVGRSSSKSARSFQVVFNQYHKKSGPVVLPFLLPSVLLPLLWPCCHAPFLLSCPAASSLAFCPATLLVAPGCPPSDPPPALL